MNRFDIINRIGDKYRVGNTETGEFSYAQALKTVGKDIKDYQKATTGTQHKFLDLRFENERLAVLVECKNKFSRWDKAKIQGQLQDYVRFEKAYSDKKIVAILAETDGDEVWVWFGQSVIIDDEHRMEEETVLRTFEEYEDLCFGRVNDKIKVVDSIKTLNEKLHSDGINEKLRSQFVGTCLLALKNGLVYKNIVLMNPPYNATKKCCDPDYTKGWDAKKKEDPSKGLHFVEWVARHVPSTCKMAVLLPMQAAIGNSGDVKTFKKKMLDNYTLDAVFSLPTEMFYPGAAAVACCMIFDLSQKHEKANKETFFGYYKDDKFIKRKGLGRVERTDADGNSLWNKTEEIWLNLYKNKKVVPGLSVMHRVSWKDEWLAEAYMETDYSTLVAEDFQKTINDYLSYLVKEGHIYEA